MLQKKQLESKRMDWQYPVNPLETVGRIRRLSGAKNIRVFSEETGKEVGEDDYNDFMLVNVYRFDYDTLELRVFTEDDYI